MLLDFIGSYSSKLSDESFVWRIGTRYRRLGIAILQLVLTAFDTWLFLNTFEFVIPGDYAVMTIPDIDRCSLGVLLFQALLRRVRFVTCG
jgi:hypothetical protein